jgi:hypothetical protein
VKGCCDPISSIGREALNCFEGITTKVHATVNSAVNVVIRVSSEQGVAAGRIIRVFFKKISDTLDSVEGLSAWADMAVATSSLVSEIFRKFQGSNTKPFSISEYDDFVGVTRLFQFPHYFCTTLWKDLKERRCFAVVSNVLGVGTNFVQFAEWLRDHDRPALWKKISSVFKTDSVAWKVGLYCGSLVSSVCDLIERGKTVYHGKDGLYGIVDMVSQILSLVLTILEQVPAVPALPAAALSAISAGVGLISVFMKPEEVT